MIEYAEDSRSRVYRLNNEAVGLVVVSGNIIFDKEGKTNEANIRLSTVTDSRISENTVSESTVELELWSAIQNGTRNTIPAAIDPNKVESTELLPQMDGEETKQI